MCATHPGYEGRSHRDELRATSVTSSHHQYELSTYLPKGGESDKKRYDEGAVIIFYGAP